MAEIVEKIKLLTQPDKKNKVWMNSIETRVLSIQKAVDLMADSNMRLFDKLSDSDPSNDRAALLKAKNDNVNTSKLLDIVDRDRMTIKELRQDKGAWKSKFYHLINALGTMLIVWLLTALRQIMVGG